MDTRIWSFLLATLHTMIWVSSKNLHFASIGAVHQQVQILQSPKFPFLPKQEIESMGKTEVNEEELSRIGSRPPNCEHKCRGCTPCSPIQVPTNNAHVHDGPQYANYEPEGWKCKCGSTFFNP